MLLMGMMMDLDLPSGYDKLSDEQLLKQVGAGDEFAFRQLYQNTDKTMYSFILSVVKNPQDAEEVMQEAYLKIWTSAANYQSQGKPLAWMFTIARNLCYMKFRDRKHMADVGIDELEEKEPGQFDMDIEQAADKLVLKTALEILKEDERQIVLLHASAGLKHREVAASLKMPLATVLSKYNRAMKKLEKYLREE